MTFLRSSCSLFIRHSIVGVFVFICLPAFSLTTSEKLTSAEVLSKTDILSVGSRMYTESKDWESGVNLNYNKDAFFGFSEKFNTFLETDTEQLGSELKKLCQGCSPIMMPSFDSDPEFLHFIQRRDLTESGDLYLGYLMIKHLNPEIREKVQQMTAIDIVNLARKNGVQMATIFSQVQDLTNGYRDAAGNGLYFDGNIENSPYDILDDLRRIYEIFFREAPEFGDYINTSAEDAPALISGHVSTGSWGGGETYHIDLASDIEEALGGGDSGNGSGGVDGELAGDCTSGYCITIDFIKNTHYFLGQAGDSDRGKNSFQGLFEDGLEWLIKYGDNRNFACKVTPTINTWESEFSLGAFLRKLFSGVSVHVFWRTPPFLQGQKEINGTESKEEKLKKQDKETVDSLRDAFFRRDIDSERKTNTIAGNRLLFQKNVYENTARQDSDMAAMIASYNQMKKNTDEFELALGQGTERIGRHKISTDSIEMVEKMFDSLGSNVKKLLDLLTDMNIRIDALEQKPKCPTS